MNLPEIADTLYSKGFKVKIAPSHEFIAVSLNRRVDFSEIEAACDYEISSKIRMSRANDGKSVIVRG